MVDDGVLRELGPLSCTPIGVVHSPLIDRLSAPRQSSVAADIEGWIELFPGRGYEDGLRDLAGFSHIWVVFWFHQNGGWRPTVSPPRSERKRGVFATRSPHRPNPIGLSAVRLLSIEDRRLGVRGLDLLDGTPVLDIKPYIAYADAIPDADAGWLGAAADPGPQYNVSFSPLASEQLAFLRSHGVELETTLRTTLSVGPTPHAYRRIRRRDDGFVVAIRDFRAPFEVQAQSIRVSRLESAVRKAELYGGDASLRRGAERNVASLAVHRLFCDHFGDG